MKRSLIWRILFIVGTLALAVLSLFPIKDKDFLQTFEKLAAPKLAELKVTKEQADKAANAAQAKFDAATDKAGVAARQFSAEQAKQKAEAKRADDAATGYATMLGEAKRRMATGDVKDNPCKDNPYLAIKLTAKGDETRDRFLLGQVIEVPGASNANNDQALSYVRRVSMGKFRLGLDLRGGTEFIVGFDAKSIPPGRSPEEVRDQILEILRNRVDALGVAEPEIKPIGPTSISVRMPSIREDDKADIRKVIEQTAKLEFHLVNPRSSELVAKYHESKQREIEPGYIYKEMEVERDGKISLEGLFIKRLPEAVRGEDLERAFPTFNQFGSYAVSLSFNSKGTKAFADATTEYVNQRLAIVLDGKVYSAPVIREPILQGSAEISGNFSTEEAKQLAVVLQCGKLPVSISIDSEFGTDPTLGRDSIESGLRAGVIGTTAVVVFMLIYYHLSGLLAVMALGANTLFVFSGMALLGSTITLPGIAGIVLGIGMAVDANVLIFERIREELDNKKTLANAVHAGFDRAFLTILDSNLTTMITCIILMWCGSGSIKGFAITLTIGLVANMFTAVFMTRVIYDLMLHNGWLKRITMLRFLTNPNFDILAIRKPVIAASVAVILATFVVIIVKGRDVLSIDFSGGTQVTYRYTGPAPDIGAVRKAVEEQGYQDPRPAFKASGVASEHMLEVVLPNTGKVKASDSVDKDKLGPVLSKAFPNTKFELVQTNVVGGLVGKEFQVKAIMAIILSWLAIVLYVAFRFEFRYGVAAVFGLVHDVIIGAAACVLLGRQFSLPVLAAILTIIGYSINDTIVVFDRIRENLGLRKGLHYYDLINQSVNQMLARTLITSLTAIISVLALFLFGGGAINDFSLVMLAGTVTGVYSTIFITGALIVVWHKHTSATVD